jgi:hypothetical protein
MAVIECMLALCISRLVKFELLLELKIEQKHGTRKSRITNRASVRPSYIGRISRQIYSELAFHNRSNHNNNRFNFNCIYNFAVFLHNNNNNNNNNKNLATETVTIAVIINNFTTSSSMLSPSVTTNSTTPDDTMHCLIQFRTLTAKAILHIEQLDSNNEDQDNVKLSVNFLFFILRKMCGLSCLNCSLISKIYNVLTQGDSQEVIGTVVDLAGHELKKNVVYSKVRIIIYMIVYICKL